MKNRVIKLIKASFAVFLFGGVVSAQQAIDWKKQADGLRGRNNQQFSYRCTPNGTVSSRLWGTDLYTDDSSICTAAVHAGLISVRSGGVVTIEIRPGASSYTGTRRNAVTSHGYGGWSGSFVFLKARSDDNATKIAWGTQADRWRGQNGRRYRLECPAGESVSSRLWGTDLYTDDSSICTAAVHAGLIKATTGGVVTIEIRAGARSYAGTTRNGVTSQSYGAWRGSFVFVR